MNNSISLFAGNNCFWRLDERGRCWPSTSGLCFLFVLAQILFPDLLSAQQAKVEIRLQEAVEAVEINRAVPANVVIRRQGFGGLRVAPAEQGTSKDEASAAILKTDPDLEASLETAERFRNDGNYRVATQIWQALLQRSGDALYSSDGETYFSLAQQVESIIARLPPEGLETYRINADAQAREIMAQAADPNDVSALSKIIQLYFLSSLGDDSAFRLGCIYLDRYDFMGAQRMFEKVLNQYPNSDIPEEQLKLRIAICQAFLGQLVVAGKALDDSGKSGNVSNQVALIRQNLDGLSISPELSSSDSGYTSYLGSSRRYGVMPAFPDKLMESDLSSAWQFFLSPLERYNATDAAGKSVLGSESDTVRKTVSAQEETILGSWRKHNWRPVGNLLFDQERIYFKSGADYIAWNRKKVYELAARESKTPEVPVNDGVAWRSLWRNAFDIDDATMNTQMIRKSYGNNPRSGGSASTIPETYPEVQNFLDEVYQQHSLCGSTIYSIEGARYDKQRKSDTRRPSIQWNATYRRSRTNFLTAYDAKSGVALWSLPRTEDGARTTKDPVNGGPAPEAEVVNNVLPNALPAEKESPYLDAGGFMSAPIEFGNLLIVPVNQGGAISVYALDAKQEGKTVWKSFLCDESESGAEPCSPIFVSVDGSDLFVCTGMGVVFVLDPGTGVVRFAKKYKRNGKADDFFRRSGWTNCRMEFSGWSNDIVVPYGRQMICFASDTDAIFALDRNNGELIWRTEMNPVGYKIDYLLGIHNDILYAAGQETVIAFDLKGEGRMVWGADQMFDGKISKGRGLLTEKGVFIPVENAIYQFSISSDNKPGELIRKVGVDLGTGAPVGNLFSDGERIWVHAGNRLHLLKNLE